MRRTLKFLASIVIIAMIGFITMASFIPAGDAKTPAGPPKTYIVHGGDTLWTIVEDHHEYDSKDPREVIWDIKQINHMKESVIQPGQEIILP